MIETPAILPIDQVRELDRRATREYGIPSLLLMENAGRSVAERIHSLLRQEPTFNRVVVFCGTGNNGGDGLVVARHLFQMGRKVEIFLVGEKERIKGDTKTNLEIVEKLGIPLFHFLSASFRVNDFGSDPTLLVDALLGTGFKGVPQEPLWSAIQKINELKQFQPASKVIAVDIPSGLSGDKGVVGAATVQADITMTLACLKPGLVKKEAKFFVGQVEVVDIGIPQKLLESFLRTVSE